MKKFGYVLVFLFSMFFVSNVFAEEKSTINVHLFKSSTCPHCAEAMEFFEELEKDSEYSQYFHLIPYETYGKTEEIQNNVRLAEKVENHFNGEFTGVPLIVIGDKKYDGYASTLNDELKERIKTCYEEQCEDIVLAIQNDTLKGNPFDALIPIIIAVVVIGGVGYLILLCCKPVSNELDVTEEEVSHSKENELENKPKTQDKKKTSTTSKKKTNVTKK